MNKKFPKVSIITVTYNCHETIEQTIQNVLKQTYPNLEYIVIDGGSTDGTVEVINKYADRLAFWVSEPDKGIYDAMNKGTLVATGEWVLFRNSGDFFFSPETMMDVFRAYEDKGEEFIYGGMRLFTSNGYCDTLYQPQGADIWRRAYFPHPATFIRRTTQLRIPYPTEFRVASDYYFFQKLVLEGASYTVYNGIVTLFDNETGISSTTFLGCKESTEILRRLGAPKEVVRRNQKDYYNFSIRAYILKQYKRLRRFIPKYGNGYIHPGWVKQPKSVTLQDI